MAYLYFLLVALYTKIQYLFSNCDLIMILMFLKLDICIANILILFEKNVQKCQFRNCTDVNLFMVSDQAWLG